MQRGWALYLLQKNLFPCGAIQGSLSHQCLSSCTLLLGKSLGEAPSSQGKQWIEKRERDSPSLAMFFLSRLELKIRERCSAAALTVSKKTSRLLMPNECLLKPRQPYNCAVQPVKIWNCLLSACLPLFQHAFLNSSE